MSRASCAYAVLLAAGLVTGGLAHAFTYDTHATQQSAAARLQDPDDALTGNSDDDDSKSKTGFSMHFSGGGGNDDNSPADSRFAPSANNAFSSPFSQSTNLDTIMNNRRH